MPDAGDISSRFWNQPQKGREEEARERTFIDDIIQKDHIERRILEAAEGAETVIDGGAGSGRFSLLLARRGLHVTHYDISLPMIECAREKARELGIERNITFVHGRLEELSAFDSGAFDLVLSIDAPISYTWPNHEDVIRSLVRIARRTVILSVASNIGWIPYLFNPAQKAQYILNKEDSDPFVRWTLDQALPTLPTYKPDMARVREVFSTHMMGGLDDMLKAHGEGAVQWPHTYAFMPDELSGILRDAGAKDIRLSGPGALSRSIPNEVLVNIMRDEALRREFLDFCYEYDSNPYCAGMGKDNLVACASISTDG